MDVKDSVHGYIRQHVRDFIKKISTYKFLEYLGVEFDKLLSLSHAKLSCNKHIK